MRVNIGKSYWRIATFIALLLCTSALQAATTLAEHIKKELEDNLYPIESVIPGYERPVDTPPKFAVAEFRTGKKDLIPWSQAIAEILRYRIQYVPGVRLVMPNPVLMTVDAQITDNVANSLLTQKSAFRNLFDSIGTEVVLTGSVDQAGAVYTLVTELTESATGEVMSQERWQFDSTQLPETIIAIVEWAYSSLGVVLAAEELGYVQDKQSLDVQAIDDFVSIHANLQRADDSTLPGKLSELKEAHPQFILYSVYYLANKANAANLDVAYENLEMIQGLLSLNPGNAGLQIAAYQAMDMGILPKHDVSEQLNIVKNLISQNPQDPNSMSALADGLVFFGESVDSIAVLLEATERWPENYRLWWSLGWALNQHAWQVRGNSMWRDLPERAKAKFQALMPLSLRAIDKALELNSRNPELWVLKLSTLGGQSGFSDELIDVFDTAAAKAPYHYPLYEVALHFSADQWSGTAEARKHIIEVAEKNNPDANWTQAMRQYHATDFNVIPDRTVNEEASDEPGQLLNRPEMWLIGSVLAVLALWIGFVWVRKPAVKNY